MLRIGIGSDILNAYVAMVNSSMTAEVLCNTRRYSMIRTFVVVRVYDNVVHFLELTHWQCYPRPAGTSAAAFHHLSVGTALSLTHSAPAAQDHSCLTSHRHSSRTCPLDTGCAKGMAFSLPVTALHRTTNGRGGTNTELPVKVAIN